MKKIKITFWPGYYVKVTKVSKNNGYLTKDEFVCGEVVTVPIVGIRFTISNKGYIPLSTNIIVNIISHHSKGGEFETLSGSVYIWEILENTNNSEPSIKEVEIPENTFDLIKNYINGKD